VYGKGPRVRVKPVLLVVHGDLYKGGEGRGEHVFWLANRLIMHAREVFEARPRRPSVALPTDANRKHLP